MERAFLCRKPYATAFAQAEEAGRKPVWGREGAKPRAKPPRPPLRRVCGDVPVRDGSRMAETPPYRRLGAQPDSPVPKGKPVSFIAFDG